jgi:hypothetical protein
MLTAAFNFGGGHLRPDPLRISLRGLRSLGWSRSSQAGSDAGETVADLVADYDLSVAEIDDAVLYERVAW